VVGPSGAPAADEPEHVEVFRVVAHSRLFWVNDWLPTAVSPWAAGKRVDLAGVRDDADVLERDTNPNSVNPSLLKSPAVSAK
jgi:hypothetical protein